ncbi:enoyl-CoA hydratase [Kineosporia sp. J2-2]|uniref:Enoyl-CoA hydratase n=1 Tax=Kineosporia corallincola TaxID=2835133 RepID=A0ABS5TNW7_9ACTN|nr:enoyl-CoA hydratase [Kineosporia corallincola]MBT0771896.1 enoyl-CoA hydratase [Kineosporia corallincola]
MRSVRLEKDGPVRHIVLDAPKRRNALSAPMLDELAEAVARVAGDEQARALVIRAEGKAFCAGADLHGLFGDLNRPTSLIRDDLKRIYASFLGVADLSIPTIAAVHGVAVGAGMNIALACDIVIAGKNARFAISFADIGLHPGGGASWFLTRRMGADRALAAIIAAETIEAEDGLRHGLVTRLADDPVRAATELAHQAAARDPGLLRDAKRAVQIAETSELPEVLEFESWAQAATVGRPDFAEYVERFTRR